MSYSTGHSLLSSPDPLNDSPTFSSPVKSQTARTRRSFPLQGSSPRKQTFQLDVGDKLSPQKIKVTVEAEHPEGHISERTYVDARAAPLPINYRVPAIRQSVRTTTTTVPVKGLSDSEDDFDSASEKPVRGRGRPRKSFGTPVPTKSRNRALTPKANQSPARRRTFGNLVDGDDSEDWDFAIGAGVEVSRGKGRSRSRSLKGATRNKSTPAAKQLSSPEKTVSSAAGRKGRGRRKTLTPEEIIIHEDKVDTASPHIFRDTDEGAMVNEELAGRDVNTVPAISATLIGQETVLFEENDLEPLTHKFSPAKKTPKKATRSSSMVGSADIRSSTGIVGDESSDRAKVPAKSSPRPIISYGSENLKDNELSRNDEKAEDEIQEFDTILESEGFSMISVDSVPSLREHISSPAGPSQNSLESLATTDVGGALSLNINAGSYLEDSFSSIAPEILEAATPKRKPSNSMLRAVLSSKIHGDEDSFSSIPPEILEAATPGKHGLNSKLLSLKVQESKPDDDSFSSIPPAILDAATPAKFAKTEATLSRIQAKPKSSSKPVSKLAIISSFPLSETGKRNLTSSGLLTPNDTPSPTDIAGQQHSQSDDSTSKTMAQPPPEACDISSREESSIVDSKIGSSPPSIAARRFTYAADSRQPDLLHGKHMETPSIMFSSPMLPPLIQKLPFAQSQLSSKSNINNPPKQSLSPAVRAGRVLQDIAVASTSRSRTQSLGSPFKSPAAQRKPAEISDTSPRSTQLIIGPQKSTQSNKGESSNLFVGFSDDTKRELRRSMLMGEEFAQGQKPGAMINSVRSFRGEDPFHSNDQLSSSPSQNEGKQYSLEVPSQPSQKSRFRAGLLIEDEQFQGSLHSESAMSWQAENAVTLPIFEIDRGKMGHNGATERTELFQKRHEVGLARERTNLSSQTAPEHRNKVTSIDSDNNKQRVEERNDLVDIEEDIWQAEARNSSSILEQQPCEAPIRQDPSERPRRSKIPSPWRKDSSRLVYSDELAKTSSPHQTGNNNIAPSIVPVEPRSKTTQTAVQKQPVTHTATDDEEDFPDSSIVWHIPQKLNFEPRPRNSGNLDLSALLASSPLKLPQRTSSLHSEPDPLIFETTQNSYSKPADFGQSTFKSGSNKEENLQIHSVESVQLEDTFQGNSGIDSTSTSDEQSELVSEISHGDSRVHYPTLSSNISLSPQKSCLRTPLSDSPSKSVAFALPTPPAPPLSATTWSKSHWQLIHGIYNKAKFILSSSSDTDAPSVDKPIHDRDEIAVVTSKYLGKKIHARGEMLTLEQWHLDIVREFIEEVPGWDEGVIAKRLFAIIIGEKMRTEGKV